LGLVLQLCHPSAVSPVRHAACQVRCQALLPPWHELQPSWPRCRPQYQDRRRALRRMVPGTFRSRGSPHRPPTSLQPRPARPRGRPVDNTPPPPALARFGRRNRAVAASVARYCLRPWAVHAKLMTWMSAAALRRALAPWLRCTCKSKGASILDQGRAARRRAFLATNATSATVRTQRMRALSFARRGRTTRTRAPGGGSSWERTAAASRF
jgi:hypothetical protein